MSAFFISPIPRHFVARHVALSDPSTSSDVQPPENDKPDDVVTPIASTDESTANTERGERHTLYVGNLPYGKSQVICGSLRPATENRILLHILLFTYSNFRLDKRKKKGMNLEEIRSMFSGHVSVKYINLPRNEKTGEIKGFAFIDVESAEDIPKAVDALNGIQAGDRPLRVSKVLEKDQIRSKKQSRE